MIALTVAGIFGYVFVSNKIVSNKYSIKLLKDEFNKSSINLELAKAAVGDSASIENLTAFAKQKGMIEANDETSFFNNSGVAVSSPVRESSIKIVP